MTEKTPISELIRLAEAGLSLTEISKVTGISRQHLWLVLKKQGVKTKGKAGRKPSKINYD